MTKAEALKIIESAEWLADKIVAQGDYAKEASLRLKQLARMQREALAQPAQFGAEYMEGFNAGKMFAELEQPAQETQQKPVALLEALSDLEHQQWMKWARSIIDSEPISEARKQRWLTMMVDYKDLPDNIQEYDREWARKVMAITRPAPAREPLSEKEIIQFKEEAYVGNENGGMKFFDCNRFARIIEKAHGIGGDDAVT